MSIIHFRRLLGRQATRLIKLLSCFPHQDISLFLTITTCDRFCCQWPWCLWPSCGSGWRPTAGKYCCQWLRLLTRGWYHCRNRGWVRLFAAVPVVASVAWSWSLWTSGWRSCSGTWVSACWTRARGLSGRHLPRWVLRFLCRPVIATIYNYFKKRIQPEHGTKTSIVRPLVEGNFTFLYGKKSG